MLRFMKSLFPLRKDKSIYQLIYMFLVSVNAMQGNHLIHFKALLKLY